MKIVSRAIELIQQSDNTGLKALLQEHPDVVNEKTEQGISLLCFAAYCGNQEALEMIQILKPEIDAYEAIIIGNEKQVNNCLATNPEMLNAYSTDGFTLVGLACFFEQLSMVKLLIKKGADINMASNNDFKVTPLHSACAKSHIKIAELLLNNGADVNAKQQSGVTALHSAAHNGADELVQLLIDNGADVNAKMVDGQTPLFMAKENNHQPACELIKNHGGL